MGIGAPQLRWDGADPVVVGGPVLNPDGSESDRVYAWRFVSGSADQVVAETLTGDPSSGPHAVDPANTPAQASNPPAPTISPFYSPPENTSTTPIDPTAMNASPSQGTPATVNTSSSQGTPATTIPPPPLEPTAGNPIPAPPATDDVTGHEA